jgi:hypothetical protein
MAIKSLEVYLFLVSSRIFPTDKVLLFVNLELIRTIAETKIN